MNSDCANCRIQECADRASKYWTESAVNNLGKSHTTDSSMQAETFHVFRPNDLGIVSRRD